MINRGQVLTQPLWVISSYSFKDILHRNHVSMVHYAYTSVHRGACKILSWVEVAASSFMEVFSISEQKSPIFLKHLAPISEGSAVSS